MQSMRLLMCSWAGQGLWSLCRAHGAGAGLRVAGREAACICLETHPSADCQCSAISKKIKLFQMQFVATPSPRKKKKKKAKPLAWNHLKSRQHIIHYRKYKRLMQFYRQLEGAKFASPHNSLQISLWKTKKIKINKQIKKSF